jgi:FlaA1/EpsC-like NDP-sugar epimerase
MGEPVKIMDLAKRLVATLRPTHLPPVEITGLRTGEKLTEVLFSHNDIKLDQPHELLWRYAVPSLEPESVVPLLVEDQPEMVGMLLSELVENASLDLRDQPLDNAAATADVVEST